MVRTVTLRYITVLVLSCFLIPSAVGGKLSEFEADAENSAQTDSDDSFRSYEDDDDDDSLSYLFIDLFSLPFRLGGHISFLRVGISDVFLIDFDEDEDEESGDIEQVSFKRVWGEPLTPYFRLDGFGHVGKGDVYSANSRWEVGFGPFAFEWRYADLRERNSDDRITISSANFLYRMAFGKRFGVDLGFGSMNFQGTNFFEGIAVTIPFLYYHNSHIGLEWRPTWYTGGGVAFVDHQVNLHLGWKYLSFMGGYRWLRSDEVSLSGPIAGLSVRW